MKFEKYPIILELIWCCL